MMKCAAALRSSVKILRRPSEPASRDEISAAALQFVRKVSGYRKPSRANQAAFDQAVVSIADCVETLLRDLGEKKIPAGACRFGQFRVKLTQPYKTP